MIVIYHHFRQDFQLLSDMAYTVENDGNKFICMIEV